MVSVASSTNQHVRLHTNFLSYIFFGSFSKYLLLTSNKILSFVKSQMSQQRPEDV